MFTLVQGPSSEAITTNPNPSFSRTRLQVLYRRLKSPKKSLNSAQDGKRRWEEVMELHYIAPIGMT